MSDTVDLELNTTCDEGAAGDKVTVTTARAKTLISGGAARPATKPAARAVGAPDSTAATATK